MTYLQLFVYLTINHYDLCDRCVFYCNWGSTVATMLRIVSSEECMLRFILSILTAIVAVNLVHNSYAMVVLLYHLSQSFLIA